MNSFVRRAVFPLTAITALALPGAAHAFQDTIGSNLQSAATVSETWPEHSAFWATRYAEGTPLVAPSKGQAIIIRLKGMAMAAPGAPEPEKRIRFQVLRPQPNGTSNVVFTSENFQIPTTGDPN